MTTVIGFYEQKPFSSYFWSMTTFPMLLFGPEILKFGDFHFRKRYPILRNIHQYSDQFSSKTLVKALFFFSIFHFPVKSGDNLFKFLEYFSKNVQFQADQNWNWPISGLGLETKIQTNCDIVIPNNHLVYQLMVSEMVSVYYFLVLSMLILYNT